MSVEPERRLDDVVVVAETGTLRRGERSVALEPRVMDVLLRLIDADGHVVSRDELIDTVWQGRPGADAALTTAVSKLRRALTELGASPDRIRTVPKRGYQLRAPEPESEAPASSAPVSEPPAASSRSARPLRRALALVLLIGAVSTVLWFALPSGDRSTSVAGPPTRLVVAAFAGAGETAALALGIAEEIRSRLAAHPELQLVNLPVAAGEATADDFDALADEAVDYVLTGRVRPGATDDGSETVRLAVRLDRVGDRTSVWGDVMVLPDASLFDAEQRIAEAVAAAVPGLGPLPPPLQPAVADPLAYRLYVQAIGPLRRGQRFGDDVRRSYFQLERAVEIDPEFAVAWAAMAVVLSQQERWFLEEIDRTAWEALARAEALDRDHPEVLIARGTVQLVHGSEPGTDSPLNLVAPFLDALAIWPESIRARLGLAEALAAQGNLRAALRVAESALARAPRDGDVLGRVARLNASTRNWARAETLIERAGALQPDNYLPWQGRAEMRLMRTGDPLQALAILEAAPASLIPDKLWADFRGYAGDTSWTMERAEARIEEFGLGSFAAQWPVFALNAAYAFKAAGETDRATELAAATRVVYARSVGPGMEAWIGYSGLAYIDWLTGRTDAALRNVCLAVEAWRARGGNSPTVYEEFARIAALTGHLDLARSLVDQLVRIDYGRTPLNVHALRLETAWQPLREAPGFDDWLATFPPPSRTAAPPERPDRIDFERFRQRSEEPPILFDASGVDALCTEVAHREIAMNS